MDTRNEKNSLFHIILKLVNSGKCLWNLTSGLVLWVKNHLQVDVMPLNVCWTTWQDLICTSEGYCVIRLSGSQHPGDHFEISTPSRSWPGVPRVIQSPRRINFYDGCCGRYDLQGDACLILVPFIFASSLFGPNSACMQCLCGGGAFVSVYIESYLTWHYYP